MTHEQILEKAIQKAIEGGWTHRDFNKEGSIFTDYDEEAKEWFLGSDWSLHVYGVIFSHDFAKALWGWHSTSMGAPNKCIKCGQELDDPNYREGLEWYCAYKHLQQMVISNDPISYLEEHL